MKKQSSKNASQRNATSKFMKTDPFARFSDKDKTVVRNVARILANAALKIARDEELLRIQGGKV